MRISPDSYWLRDKAKIVLGKMHMHGPLNDDKSIESL